MLSMVSPTCVHPKALTKSWRAAFVGLGLVALEGQAFAAPNTSATPAKPNVVTSSRQPEPEVHGVRTLLEFESVFLLGLVYYLTTADFAHQFDVGYRWDVFRRKISAESFVIDTNHFGTNFIGHPLGGAGYYASARANGIGTLGSSAVSIMGSLLWELFGEVREEISMNDMIVTPMAGISIGETTFQVARFFDRSEANLVNRSLGLLLGPLTTINDALDGTKPDRVSAGFATGGWHQVMTRAGVSVVNERRAAHLEAAVAASVRLENLPDYLRTTELTTSWFDAGNVSQLRVELGASSSGLSRVDVTTQAVLLGLDYAARRSAQDAEFGFIGLGMGFEYTARSYQRGLDAPLNRLSAVQPIGVASGHHVRRGALTLDSWLRVGPAFGGIDPLVLTPEQRLDPALQPVARLHGYYLGGGASGEAQLQFGFGDWRWGGAMAAEGYQSSRAPGEPTVTSMADTYRQTQAYFGYHFPGTASELRADWVWRDRASTIDQEHHHFKEHSLGLHLCAFGN